MAEKLFVMIQKDPTNLLRCFANGFSADRGSTVRFVFVGQPQAEIEFPGNSKLDTPFDKGKFLLDAATDASGSGVIEMKVRDDAEPGSYGYTVKWIHEGDGLGNGGGVVRHSR
jgi:hypothetical protein